ncbi:putative conserved protein YbbC, DUF1343 family [Abditibacterium utsteinense]|uniref:Putative conserved protein YbbC, DUF1343 family n=1 Tax=Abditibacterium utsteinense TaxID=1960156 RepID=A0A2S8SSZ2_9BACT|nr:DUF1343 domain-containing protein [Abditibacterium utsteinense]PQV63934.1 putative conserved protein YbbC, DUF1343 family [Abditibacterium utsteinense]
MPIPSPICLPGLDALIAGHQSDLRQSFQGKKIGLLTNQIGQTQTRQPALHALRSSQFNVLALFAPEHGPQGLLEGEIDHSKLEDDTPVYSLYGKTRRPTPQMLHGLDAVVCDLQDVGARFYTNISTVYETMEACAPLGIAVVILDRPNPLGGLAVEGPTIDFHLMSFIGAAPLPVTHGLTLGELALRYRSWKKLDVEVKIARIEGWTRAMLWNQTDLKWRQPSPNLPDIQSAAWYPGLALLEFCNLSVGRGTKAPFQILGSPNFRAKAFLDAFDASDNALENIAARAIEFTPTRATFAGQTCAGVRFSCKNFPARPVEFGLRAMHALLVSHPDFPRDNWDLAGKLVGSQSVLQALWNGDLSWALEKANADAAEFRRQRAEFLIY